MLTCNRFIMLMVLLLLFDTDFLVLSQTFSHNNLNKLDDLDPAESIFLSQSEACSNDDDINRIQCFRELPLPKYEVLEGEDVLMRCRVAYQRGKLQWAFKGKMLGFDRTIPNYPRLRMPGNAVIGDHSLFIESAKVTDSGNYECQLSPSASQPPRRRLTNLLVLRVPSKPVIYRDGSINKENISVSIKKDVPAFVINLTCVASDGNPSPTFEWSLNDDKLQSESIFRSVRTQIRTANDTASVLSLRSDQVYNNDVISCAVFNAATRRQVSLSERIIVTNIRVLKRILPGPLRFKEMSLTANTITVHEREQLRLSCLTNDPGDPPITLGWKTSLRGAISEDMITNTHNEIVSQSSIVVPSIESSWHRSTVTCSGTQDGSVTVQPISASILVKHLPKKIDISAISLTTNSTLENPSIVYVKDDQIIKLVCSTGPFYSDNVKIVWFTKSAEDSDWKRASESSEKNIDLDEARLRLLKSVFEISPSLFEKSNLRKEPTKFFLNVVCIMKSSDSSGEIRRQVRIEAYEPPSNPIITINDERNSAVLINGQSVKIKCAMTGGHPIPELHLVDENRNTLTKRTYFQLSSTILEYNIEVKHRDNGKKFRCITALKSTLDYKSMESELATLRVAIPPRTLTMMLPESKFHAYQYASYSCFTDSSFPRAKIEWHWYHSCKNRHMKLAMMSRLSSSDLKQFCESVQIEENNISNLNPSSDSTTSTINIKLLPTHDLTFIECVVFHDPKWTSYTSKLSKIAPLRVQYPPQFPAQLEKVYIVEEGQNLTIAINASANPAINGYTWLVNKQPITSKSQIELKVDQFSVSNAQHDMMGNYTLLLENPLGKNSLSFFLNITFAPKLLGPSTETIKSNSVKEYRQKAVITCSAQTNPFREQAKVQWTRESPLILDNNDLIGILKGHSPFSTSPPVHCAKDQWKSGNISVDCISLGSIEILSRFQINPMDHRYIGSYTCIFSNNIKPASAVKTTHLVFPTAPEAIDNRRKSEYAAKLGGKTEIACYFIAFPSPTITWTRTQNIILSENIRKYATSVSNPQSGLIKAVLAIRETNQSDIGKYTCMAQNSHGKSYHSVTLAKPRPPTQPTNATVMNASDTSITVGWIPGFNGGSKQTVELRWRPYDIGRDGEYSILELAENEDSDVQIHTLTDLQHHKEYEILIHSTNRFTINQPNPIQLFAKTMQYGDEPGGQYVQSDWSKSISKGKNIQDKADSSSIWIIILLSIIGGLLIGLKVGLVTYFVRRRQIKKRKSMDKMSSPVSQRIVDGYLTSADSMEMRAPSLVRSGIESNMYAQSLSDHLSQNGSDNGLKLNYYKTTSDEFQSPYLSPELDLVASAMGRNNFNLNGVSSNFHPAYIQFAESSSLTGYPEPYLTGYYTHKPVYQNPPPARAGIQSPNHSAIDTNALPQYPISTSYPKRPDSNNYPSSAVSISTASNESNRSRSPNNRKYAGYSPLIGQSGAPSTVEEYLSSANSGSEYHRFPSNGNDEYPANPMSSFRLNQTDFYKPPTQDPISAQESTLEIPSHKMKFDNGRDFHYAMIDDRLHLSMSSDGEQLLKPPIDFMGPGNGQGPQKPSEMSKLNYVDLISHSSPSVIRITGTISENL